MSMGLVDLTYKMLDSSKSSRIPAILNISSVVISLFDGL